MGSIVCRECRFAHEGPCKPHVRPKEAHEPIQCAECAALRKQLTERDTVILALRKQLTELTEAKSVNKPVNTDRAEYMREYMRKRRERVNA